MAKRFKKFTVTYEETGVSESIQMYVEHDKEGVSTFSCEVAGSQLTHANPNVLREVAQEVFVGAQVALQGEAIDFYHVAAEASTVRVKRFSIKGGPRLSRRGVPVQITNNLEVIGVGNSLQPVDLPNRGNWIRVTPEVTEALQTHREVVHTLRRILALQGGASRAFNNLVPYWSEGMREVPEEKYLEPLEKALTTYQSVREELKELLNDE